LSNWLNLVTFKASYNSFQYSKEESPRWDALCWRRFCFLYRRRFSWSIWEDAWKRRSNKRFKSKILNFYVFNSGREWWLKMHRLCDELLFVIASYFDNLKYFVRLWIAFLLHKRITKKNSIFWSSLLQFYFRELKIDLKPIVNRNTLYTNVMGFDLLVFIFSNRKCTNSGCFKYFNEIFNGPKSCSFHPGKLKATGLLTCCNKRGFQTTGCRNCRHNGEFFAMVNLKREHSTPNRSAS
jgi:hypothetical protein